MKLFGGVNLRTSGGSGKGRGKREEEGLFATWKISRIFHPTFYNLCF